MASEVFDKFNAILHFFPEFQVAIDAGGDNEIGFRDNNMRYYVAMHVTLLIAFNVWQIFQVKFFIFKYYHKERERENISWNTA